MTAESCDDLQKLLQTYNLEKYFPAFQKKEVILFDLQRLTEHQLKVDFGMSAIHAQRLLNAIQKEHVQETGGLAEFAPYSELCLRIPAASLPTYIAPSWRGFCSSTHPRESLYRLVDTLEAAVRFSTTVAFSEYISSIDGPIQIDLARKIHSLIRAPTLGQWLGLLRLLVREQRSLKSDLVQVVDLNPVSEAFDNNCAAHERDQKSLLVMRNALAHGGGFSVMQAGQYCSTHAPQMMDILEVIVEALTGTQLLGMQKGRLLELKGESPAEVDISCPPFEREEVGPWIVRDKFVLNLDPMLAFRPISFTSAERQTGTESISQLFSRLDKRAVCYTPVGVDLIQTEDSSAVTAFRNLLRLDELNKQNRQQRRSLVNGFAWHDFLDEAHLMSGGVVGRKEEITEIKSWIKEPRQGKSRLRWLHGAPGMGKSMLLAKIAADFDGGNLLRLPKQKHGHKQNHSALAVFYHQFRAGDPRNNSDAFLRLFFSMLQHWRSLTSNAGAASLPELDQQEGNELNEIVKARLRFMLRDPKITNADSEPEPNNSCLLVIIDGLDEVVRKDPSVIGLIKDLAIQGGLWLVAGRRDEGLEDPFGSEDADIIYQDGLPGMSPSDLRTLLLEKLGEKRYALLSLDEDDGGEDNPQNSFVKAVVERSAGLPLYIHLLLEDFNCQYITVHNPDRLPVSLSAYYGSLLKRLQVGDLQRALPLLVSALAISYEPLDMSSLGYLLAYDDNRRSVSNSDVRLVEAALAIAKSLFRDDVDLDGNNGYSLYHLSFQDFVLRRESELARSIRSALFLLSELADDIDNIFHVPLFNHLKRNCVNYASGFSKWLTPEERHVNVLNAARRLSDPRFRKDMLTAWHFKNEPVASSFNKVFNLLSSDSENISRKIAENFYDGLIKDGEDESALSITSVHAFLCYLKPDYFYRSVLSMTIADEMAAKNEAYPLNHSRLLARRANHCRKALENEKAAAFLDRCISNLTEFGQMAEGAPERELQRIFYDRAYLAYLEMGFDKALSFLSKSIHHAKEAGDLCGEWISRCVFARFRMLGFLVERREAGHVGYVDLDSVQRHPLRYLCSDWSGLKANILAFDSVLKEALPIFTGLGKEHANPNAERWVKNVIAHQFETAHMLVDLGRARACMHMLLANEWVSTKAGKAYMRPQKARLLALNNKHSEAASIFDEILINDQNPYRNEEISRIFFDAGWANFCSGGQNKAKSLWEKGLRQSMTGGNAHWFPLLSASIERVAS